MKKRTLKIVLFVSCLLTLLPFPQAALAQMPQGQQVTVKEVLQVNEVGDIHLEMTYTYPANYYTWAIAPQKVNPMLISEVRFMRSGQSPKEIPRESIKVDFDDVQSSIKVSCDAMGFTKNMKDYWELEIMPNATLTAQTETSIVLTSTQQQGQNTYLYTTTINFPEKAKDIKFDSSTGRIKYILPDEPSGGFPIGGIIGIVVCVLLAAIYVVRKRVSVQPKS